MLLTNMDESSVEVFRPGVPALRTQPGSGRKSDAMRFNTRYTTLHDVTMQSTLLADEVSSTVAMVLKGGVHVMMAALNGSFPIATKGLMSTHKLHTMEEHVDFGFHAGSTTWPHFSHEQHQLIEVVQLLGVKGVVGQKEDAQVTHGLVEDVEVHPCLLICDLINDHG